MLQIDKRKAGTKLECQGGCQGATKHVDLLHGSRVVWVCTICETVLEVKHTGTAERCLLDCKLKAEMGTQGGHIGDFRRCQYCKQGYWVQALNRTQFIQCPLCDTLQKR
jgi:hypothetical protein